MTRRKGGPPPAGRWCPAHGRHECTRRRHGGGECHGTPLRGADACRAHAGKTAASAKADAWQAWAAVPGDDGVSPAEAVMGELAAAVRVSAYLAGLAGDVAAVEGPKAALTGPVAAAWRDERDRVVWFAAVAHQMGIQDTWTRLAREVAGWMSARLDALLSRLGIDAHADEQIGEIVAGWIRELGPPSE